MSAMDGDEHIPDDLEPYHEWEWRSKFSGAFSGSVVAKRSRKADINNKWRLTALLMRFVVGSWYRDWLDHLSWGWLGMLW